MKKLIVSFKTPEKSLEDFKKFYEKAKLGKITEPHYEIAFDDKKKFSKFLKNIDVLIAIQSSKPSSVYELAKILDKDQSNLNKLITFFEQCGVIRIKEETVDGRTVKKPIVDYKKIEFNLAA